MYVIEVPVVSTVHLTRKTYKRLEHDIRAGMVCGAVQFCERDIVSLWWRPDTDEPYDNEPDLQKLRSWAGVRSYEWVRLDGDIGDVIDGLPTYGETWE